MTRRQQALRWAPLLILPLEIGVLLVFLNGIALPGALRVAMAMAVLAAVAFEGVLFSRSYRRNRLAGLSIGRAGQAAIGHVLPGPVVRAAGLEWKIWRSLVRGVLRRPDIPVGATAFTHHRALAPVRWIGVAVLTIEVVVVHIVVPNGVLRWVLLAIGVYGLVWVVGYLLGSGAVRPHLVTGQGIVLRCGLDTDIVVPVDVIDFARLARHGRAASATVQVDAGVVSLVDNGGTNLDIVLTAPMDVALPSNRSALVTELRVWVDDPAAMLDSIRRCTSLRSSQLNEAGHP